MEKVVSNKRRYLSIAEASEILGVNMSTVYRLARANDLPSAAIGGRILINKDAFETWLKSKENKGGICHVG